MAWERALRWLAARDRSRHELQRRLDAAGVSPAVAVATLSRLAAAGYVDDERCAHQLAESLHRRGHGSIRARHDLEVRGIAPQVVEPVLSAVYADERDLAVRVAARRFPALFSRSQDEQETPDTHPPTPDDQARAARFLHSRGFAEDIVLAILEPAC